ncbi:PQQ-dependent sugar dehydrogenase [Bizionia sp. KMM 8389]
MKQKLPLLLALFLTAFSFSQQPVTNDTANWSVTNITSNHAFNYPWEITYMPGEQLWLTERVGEKISSFNISTGVISELIDLSSKVATSKQGGLLGMAIHPDLYADISTSTNNYVYAAYTYDDAGFKLRIVRLVYDFTTNTLAEDTSLNPNGTILEGLPGSADHNSGRLIIGPDLKLYYTIGDQGANQFDYSCNPILSQVMPTSPTDYANYPGKTLRINLDGSVPLDNPVFNTVQSHVYTYGHRNSQGIIFANNGVLYASEQGPKTDDEINIIKAGKNYGWPEIAGYYDNWAYTYCNWSSLDNCNAGSFSDHNCPNGAETATEFESFPSGAPADFEGPIGTYGSSIETDPAGGWGTWPTPAVSSIDIHETGNIPGWGRSLLIPSLKKGTIYRAQLTPDGADIVNDTYEEFHSSIDRYRDLAISPDGLTIYAITDNAGGTSGPSSNDVVTNLSNPGLIVKIEYIGTTVQNPPVANCQNITVLLDPQGTATISASDIDNGSVGGDAAIVSMVIDMDTFDCSHTDSLQTVWLTVTDANGNENSCSASVNVVPNSNPAAFVAPELEDVVSNCLITVSAPVLINNACEEVTATTTDNTTFLAGESGTINWLFDDGVNSDSATQQVTVNTLSVPSNISVVPGSTYADVTWEGAEGVSTNIRYRELGGAWIIQSATGNAATINGLQMSTDYELQISAACSETESNYSSSVFFTTTAVDYCDAFGIVNGDNHHITRVVLEDLDHTSAGSTYSDFTAYATTLNFSETYTISIDKSVPNESWKTAGFGVWIDYNADGDFTDSGEFVAGTNAGSNLSPYNQVTRSFSFSVPETVLTVSTRMRVAMMQYYTPYGTNAPCGIVNTDGNSSEVEDYTIHLVGGTLNTETYNLNSVFVQPNPIKDQLTVHGLPTGNFKTLTVALYDIQGRVVQQELVGSKQAEIQLTDLENLSTGVYFIRISDGIKTLLVKKLVKI